MNSYITYHNTAASTVRVWPQNPGSMSEPPFRFLFPVWILTIKLSNKGNKYEKVVTKKDFFLSTYMSLCTLTELLLHIPPSYEASPMKQYMHPRQEEEDRLSVCNIS